MMFALLAAATVATASPTAAARSPVIAEKAVDPAAVSAATKLLVTLHVDQTIDRMIGTLVPMMTTAVMGSLEHEPATQGAMRAIESQPDGRSRMMAIFGEEMMRSMRARYPAIIDGTAREYAVVFTAAEITELDRFFATGTGAKWVAQSAQLQQAVGARAGLIGREAGMEAGARAMQRGVREILPSQKATS